MNWVDTFESFFERFIDGYFNQEDIHNEINSLIKYFESHDIRTKGTDNSSSILVDIKQASFLLAKIGFSFPDIKSDGVSQPMPDKSEIDQWISTLINNKVIHKNNLSKHTGKMMEWIGSTFLKDHEDFFSANSERILRYVEVHRTGIFRIRSSSTNSIDILLEWLDIAIFFSKNALRCNDARFLNSSLKINDWVISLTKKNPNAFLRARLLLSLAQQEYTSQELFSLCA